MDLLRYGAQRSGDEPILEAFKTHMSWSGAWPRVIARAWSFIKDGKPMTPSDSNDEWYQLLLSGNPDKVKTALEVEGFFSGKGGEHHRTWYDRNMRIIVRWAMDERTVKFADAGTSDDNYLKYLEDNCTPEESRLPCYVDGNGIYKKGEDGWTNVENIQHVIVLAIPLPPDNVGDQAIALADYNAAGKVQPFTIIC